MDTVLTALHVVAAVFLVGPMAILPMTALRAVRAGNASVVELMGTSTRIFTLGSVLVAVLGFGVVGVLHKTEDVSVATGWVLTSIVLYVVALALRPARAPPLPRPAPRPASPPAPPAWPGFPPPSVARAAQAAPPLQNSF